MSTTEPAVPAVWKRVSLDLDAVNCISQLKQFVFGADAWFDNLTSVNVYVDSETNELMIEQKYV